MQRASLFVFVALLPLAAAFSGENNKSSSVLMHKKLEYSQQILDGLTREDFDVIAKNAKIMSVFTELETWSRSALPRYDTQLKIFRFANQDLIRQAEAKNLDGVTLAYVQLTLSCVNCHKVVRDPSR